MKKMIIILGMVFIFAIICGEEENNGLKKGMIMAVKTGNLKTAEVFLKRGLDPNMKDEKNVSLIETAVYNDDFDMFKLLLENGADPYFKDKKSRNLLILTIFLDREEMAEFILNKGYIEGIEDKDENGDNAFTIAMKKENYNMMEKIIKIEKELNSKKEEDSKNNIKEENKFTYSSSEILKELNR